MYALTLTFLLSAEAIVFVVIINCLFYLLMTNQFVLSLMILLKVTLLNLNDSVN